MAEDLSAGALRLADALRRHAEEEAASGTRFAPVLESGGGFDLRECWTAVEAVRTEIDGESDPASRSAKHARLDRAALEIAEAALSRRLALHRQIIQDISHDVRSPLNSVLLLADSLLNGPGSLSPVQRRQASVLYDASVSLVRLVNDIIDASRIGQGGEIPVESAPFSVPGVLEEVRRLVLPLAEHRSVELVMEADGPRRRQGDRKLLGRVLLNLVSNGIEACGRSGRVEVRLGDSELGFLSGQVVDSGRDADVTRLRELLDATADAYPRRREGWTRGLGLAITGRLVRAAEGTVTVGRLEDGCTRFQLEFPFREA